jgi:lysozyme
MQTVTDQNLKGIDLSHWNGPVDFQKVSRFGVEVVMLKATEGQTVVDSCLDIYYAGAKAAGLKVGFYHFFLPKDLADARLQAAHFARQVEAYPADCLYALDVEDNRHNLAPELLCDTVAAFFDFFQELTKQKVMLYASRNWLEHQLAQSGALHKYPVWIAQWTTKEKPDDLPDWTHWVGWQYSSEGKVPGIQGKVDLNWFTRDALIEHT